MSKLVSLMIPTYNAAKTIEQTLDSILQQSYTNLEIVVIDNASSDNTGALLQRYNDPRLKIIINKTNIGAEGNFNKCIDLAKGDYIAIYHADDIYEPTIVEEQVTLLERYPEAGGVGTMATIIDENGAKKGELQVPTELISSKPHLYEIKNILPVLLKYGNSFLICPSMMLRNDVYKNEIKKWREELFKSAADTDVWLRVAEKHKLGIINKKLINYRHSTTHWSFQYNYLRTTRADGFLVFDYYVDKYKTLLTAEDKVNYHFSEKKDEIIRAIHYSLKHEYSNAKLLLKGLLDKDILKLGIKNIRNVKIYFAGIMLMIGLKIGLGYTIAKILKKFY